MDLSDPQREILTALLDAYQSTEAPVTGEEIAAATDRHPGTVRNQMQTLKALDLVEGIPGPRGGYKPTTSAYSALDEQEFDASDAETLTVARDYERIDVTVETIAFLEVNHPDECAVRVGLSEPLETASAGSPVVVGPTPNTGLVVAGEIRSVADGGRTLEIDVVRLEAPLTE